MAGWHAGLRSCDQDGFGWAGRGALPISAFDGPSIMPRTFSMALLTTACMAAACFAPPVLAQGVLKPLETLVVNPAGRPVPVSVVPPAAPATAMCRMDVDTGGSLLPIPGGGAAFQVGLLECSPGVTRLDVQRVVFTTGITTPTTNQVHYTVSLALAHFGGGSVLVLDAPIATLSSGTPDLSLSQPVRIDKSAAGVYVTNSIICSSGIAGLQPRCSGTVFLIGTPAN